LVGKSDLFWHEIQGHTIGLMGLWSHAIVVFVYAIVIFVLTRSFRILNESRSEFRILKTKYILSQLVPAQVRGSITIGLLEYECPSLAVGL
jgi:hypothetical protein